MADVLDSCTVDTDTITLGVADDGRSLQADARVVNRPNQAIQVVADAGLYVPGTQLVTNLDDGSNLFPTDPADGDRVEIRPDLNDLTIAWVMRWDARSGRWISLSRVPMIAEKTGASTKPSLGGVYGVCADGAGPDIQLPVLGLSTVRVYLEWGARMAATGAGQLYMSPKWSAAEAVDGPAAQQNLAGLVSVYAQMTVTVADGFKIQSRYKNADIGGTANVERRFLRCYLLNAG